MQYISYRENRRRGTDDFPLEYHHVTAAHPQYVMALHWHVEHEFIRILNGELDLTIDENQIPAKKGDFILVPAGALHAGQPHDCEYECIVFDMNMLMNKNDSCCRQIRRIMEHEVEIPLTYSPDDSDLYHALCVLFDSAASKKQGYQILILGSLYQFVGEIFLENRYAPAPKTMPRSHRKIVQIKQALEFIETNYNTPLTLEEIAGSVDMSPKYFCRFFQEMTHRTPFDYLNYYRVERACYQLLTTDLSITEIAYNSGFNDASYFIKTFKRYKGTTPKKYLR